MKVETKVGLLFIAAVAMVAAFAWYLGALNPFSNQNEVWVAYNFAGGVEGVGITGPSSCGHDINAMAAGRQVKENLRLLDRNGPAPLQCRADQGFWGDAGAFADAGAGLVDEALFEVDELDGGPTPFVEVDVVDDSSVFSAYHLLPYLSDRLLRFY